MCMKSQISCEKHKKSKAARFFLTGGDIKKGHGGGSVLVPDEL